MEALPTEIDQKIKKIEKGLLLTGSLYISSLVAGEKYSGKKLLVKRLFPDMKFVDGGDERRVFDALKENSELIIGNIEKIKNISALDLGGKRIIATYDSNCEIDDTSRLAEKFAWIYNMPPLRKRPEDATLFAHCFADMAKETFMIDIEIEIEMEMERLDLSQNLRSLKASVFREVFMRSCTSGDLKEMLRIFFERGMEGNNYYKDTLEIYEKPLLQAGLKKYGSQLKLAKVLGINRNTLRKKIYEHEIR